MNALEELKNAQRELSAIVEQIEYIQTLDGKEWSREVEQLCVDLEQATKRVKTITYRLRQ